MTKSTTATAENTSTATAHSLAGALSHPVRRLPDHGEDCETEHHDRSAEDLLRGDDLIREEVPERQREHDRRHEQGLDHREASVGERDGLEGISAQERDRAEKPPLLLRESEERPGRAERDLAHAERALLLQRRCEREEERRHECEDLGHRRRSLCPLADSRNVVEPDDLVDELEPLRPVRDEEHGALARGVEHVGDERLGRSGRRDAPSARRGGARARPRGAHARRPGAAADRPRAARPPLRRACRARPAATRPSRQPSTAERVLELAHPSHRDERASGSRGSSSRRRAPPGPRVRMCAARPPAGDREDRRRRS